METWVILMLIFCLLICLILTIALFLVHSGAFETVEVKAGKPPLGKVTIAYKFFRGSYRSDVGPEFFQVAKIAPDNKAIGIYYDDPKNVSQCQRFVVACVLAEDDQEVDGQLVKKFEDEGFRITQLPLVEYSVNSSFPYTSAVSIFMGMKKVYPKIQDYLQEHGLDGHPFVEIYAGNTIHYMTPLYKQESFYVPESLHDLPEEKPCDRSVHSAEGAGECRSAEGDKPETASLLHHSQIIRAEVVGKVSEELEMNVASEEDEDKEEEVEEEEEAEEKQSAEEAENKEESPEPEKKEAGEPGSDEESGSSFEDLKLEAEEAHRSELDSTPPSQ